AMDSAASTLEEIISETLSLKSGEREGRAIDKDTDGSMEKKKIEGYF
ncbi:MAG TPA: sulfate adenylyltransferase small subunit, partial [Campylobacterales bacterium]|nr:sulfate adenylyltransferase small subunit [Campylobacterales bacterium]